MLAEVQLTQQDSGTELRYKTPGPDGRIGPLKKVNLIVGPNNSGKSRLLRSIARCRVSRAFSVDLKLTKLWYGVIDGSSSNGMEAIDDDTLSKLIENLSRTPLPNAYNRQSKQPDLAMSFREIQRIIRQYPCRISHFNFLAEEMQVAYGKLKNNAGTVMPRVCYVPTLRGFRSPITESNNNGYCSFDDRVKAEYLAELGGENNLEIFSGGNINDKFIDLRLGDLQQREFATEFEKIMGDHFFDGSPVSLLPKRQGSRIMHIKIGTEKEQPLQNLGDGLQHLITISFAAFKLLKDFENSSGGLPVLLVEEPELFLHPGFQRRLLRCFTKSGTFDGVQLFATTQSNHLLEVAMDSDDVAVFQVAKNIESGSQIREALPRFEVTLMSAQDRTILDALGVNHASVLLANCIILVEGVTDRLYLQKLMEEYWKTMGNSRQFVLDLHYVFVEYGGSNITHFDFAGGNMNSARIFGRFFCVADRDSDQDSNSKKSQRHRLIKERIGNKFLLLDCREIENMLSAKTLSKVIDCFGKNGAKCKSEPDWFDEATYKSAPLGKYLKGILQDKGIDEQVKQVCADSGTLANKLEFCYAAIKEIDSLDGFASYSRDLAKRIDEFIKDHNKI
jgi:predicted ATP-dependent endonuclease of OLD family